MWAYTYGRLIQLSVAACKDTEALKDFLTWHILICVDFLENRDYLLWVFLLGVKLKRKEVYSKLILISLGYVLAGILYQNLYSLHQLFDGLSMPLDMMFIASQYVVGACDDHFLVQTSYVLTLLLEIHCRFQVFMDLIHDKSRSQVGCKA
jgi:hypothetical protein